jgi:hypothetical protein
MMLFAGELGSEVGVLAEANPPIKAKVMSRPKTIGRNTLVVRTVPSRTEWLAFRWNHALCAAPDWIDNPILA